MEEQPTAVMDNRRPRVGRHNKQERGWASCGFMDLFQSCSSADRNAPGYEASPRGAVRPAAPPSFMEGF